MGNCLQNKKTAFAKWFYIIWSAIVAVATITMAVIKGRNAALGVLFWGVIVLCLGVCRPNSKLNLMSLDSSGRKKNIITIIAALLTIAACVLPMSSTPIWNGEIPEHRNQYEMMTDAILDGKLYIEYGDEEGLAQLENPYSPEEREEAGVTFHWDHAFYDGHYYMYFGVVPVFLLFLPFKVLTGTTLLAYQATQIFAALSIVGIFVLFRLLADRFFKKLSFGIYISLSVAVSVISVWFSIGQPALYCTAITSAICLMVWSIYFFSRAIWMTKSENKQILFAAIGSLLGALAFGCRPPIALANLIVIPFVIMFVRQRKFSLAVLGKLVLAALPYLVVGALLMTYNYVRFDNPLEFGQAYQLTVTDQTQYTFFNFQHNFNGYIYQIFLNFFGLPETTVTFPYIGYKCGSAFVNFPVLLLVFGLARPKVIKKIRENKITLFTVFLIAIPLIITFMDVLWSPFMTERYRMDIYFLVGILCFVACGLFHQSLSQKNQKRFSSLVMYLSLISLFMCVWLYSAPQTINVQYTDKISEIINNMEQIILFWKFL